MESESNDGVPTEEETIIPGLVAVKHKHLKSDDHKHHKQRNVQFCVTTSGDGTVRLWDIHTCAQLARIDFADATDHHHAANATSSLKHKQDTASHNTCNGTPAEVVHTSDATTHEENKTNPPSSTNVTINNKDDNSNEIKNKHEKDNTGCKNDQHASKDANTQNTAVIPTEGIEHAPARVLVNGDGTILAVMRDGIYRIDLFDITVHDTDDDSTTGAFNKVRSIECPSRPLGMTFASDGSLSILTREPTFIVRWEPPSSLAAVDKGNTTKSTGTMDEEEREVDIGSNAIGEIIRNIGEKLKITMPYTLLEANESTGKVKLRKNIQGEKEGFVKYEPWLSVERVEKAKQRGLRHKKRKREKERLLGS